MGCLFQNSEVRIPDIRKKSETRNPNQRVAARIQPHFSRRRGAFISAFGFRISHFGFWVNVPGQPNLVRRARRESTPAAGREPALGRDGCPTARPRVRRFREKPRTVPPYALWPGSSTATAMTNSGLFAGNHPHKGAVTMTGEIAVAVRFLGRAGFAGHAVSRQSRQLARTVFHHAPHGCAHQPGRFRPHHSSDRLRFIPAPSGPIGMIDRLDQQGPHQHPIIGDGRIRHGELQLADRQFMADGDSRDGCWRPVGHRPNKPPVS